MSILIHSKKKSSKQHLEIIKVKKIWVIYLTIYNFKNNLHIIVILRNKLILNYNSLFLDDKNLNHELDPIPLNNIKLSVFIYKT